MDRTPQSSIKFFNRKTQRMETEKVYGDRWLNWAYLNAFGFLLTQFIFSKKWISKIMGSHQNTRSSAKTIPEFIKKYDIQMSEYEPQPFRSFNEFFIRKFKTGARSFNPDPSIFCAGAEARYLAFQGLTEETFFPVKGIHIRLSELLGSTLVAKDFLGGTILIARLCPVDYHRFHYPLSGTRTFFSENEGQLHSVNPVALQVLPDVLFKNERQLTLFENESFGKVAMLEVGALGVGKIVQSDTKVKFEKGEEKGYFLFGGSTVIWLLQKEKIKLDRDVLEQSANGIETWVPLGDRLGERSQNSGSQSTGDH